MLTMKQTTNVKDIDEVGLFDLRAVHVNEAGEIYAMEFDHGYPARTVYVRAQVGALLVMLSVPDAVPAEAPQAAIAPPPLGDGEERPF